MGEGGGSEIIIILTVLCIPEVFEVFCAHKHMQTIENASDKMSLNVFIEVENGNVK